MTADEELRPEESDPRSPEQRLKAYRAGQAKAPNWEAPDPIAGLETHLLLSEERIVHPEIRPLLCLCNTDEDGTILGEVWFAPGDIPAILASLQRELTHNCRSGQRRWLGNPAGPALYFGELGKVPDAVDTDVSDEDGDSDNNGNAGVA
jgi:hypothetical protein